MSLRDFAAELARPLIAALCALPLAAQNYNVTTFSVRDPPSIATSAEGIGDPGAVVGYYSVPQQFGLFYRGFIRQADGTLQYPITDPNDIGSQATLPWAINSAGVVAGYFLASADGRIHGFILNNGNFTTVDEITNGDTYI